MLLLLLFYTLFNEASYSLYHDSASWSPLLDRDTIEINQWQKSDQDKHFCIFLDMQTQRGWTFVIAAIIHNSELYKTVFKTLL